MDMDHTVEQNKQLSLFHYGFSLLSFIPTVGIIPAAISILFGIFTRKAGGPLLVLIGAAGLLATNFLYDFAPSDSGKAQSEAVIPDTIPQTQEAREEMMQDIFEKIVSELEDYKLENGKYPENLDELLAQSDEPFPVTDISSLESQFEDAPEIEGNDIQADEDMKIDTENMPPVFYEPVDDGYVLMGAGEDTQFGSADDVVPILDSREDLGLYLPDEIGGYEVIDIPMIASDEETERMTITPDGMIMKTTSPKQKAPSLFHRNKKKTQGE